MPHSKKTLILVVSVIAVLVVILFVISRETTSKLTAIEANPGSILGAECHIVAVTTQGKADRKKDALNNVEQVLRDIELKMSADIEGSEISLLNKAVTNQKIAISDSTSYVLLLSRKIFLQSDYAFDITTKPLITLWQDAGKEGKRPSVEEVNTARSISYFISLTVEGNTVWKDSDTTVVDLDGIARGYAADIGVEDLKNKGFKGGLIDLGGDIKCFGPSSSSDKWDVPIYSPFDQSGQQVFMTLLITDKAICTIRDFQVTSTVDGKNYGFNIEPRTGYPNQSAWLTTVIADEAAIADAWSSALSVLCSDGFDNFRKSDGIEAMVVTGTPDNFTITMTAGFESYIKEKLPDDWIVEIIK